MTSTTKHVEGMGEFGEVDIRRITQQRGRLVGVVLVPADYPGSSQIAAPEGCANMGVVSYDGGETWEVL